MRSQEVQPQVPAAVLAVEGLRESNRWPPPQLLAVRQKSCSYLPKR